MQTKLEAWVRRLASLPEAAMREAVAAEIIESADDQDAVELLRTMIVRVRTTATYARVLDALCLAVAAPTRVGYERVARLYRYAMDHDEPEVAQMLLTSGSQRVVDAKKVLVNKALSDVTLGHRKTLARTARVDTIQQLLSDPDPSVVANLMLNARLVEEDVVRLVSRRPALATSLYVVYRSRWGTRYHVRNAIARNPFTPIDLALKLLPTLSRIDLREVSRDGTLHAAVKKFASQLLSMSTLTARQTAVDRSTEPPSDHFAGESERRPVDLERSNQHNCVDRAKARNQGDGKMVAKKKAPAKKAPAKKAPAKKAPAKKAPAKKAPAKKAPAKKAPAKKAPAKKAPAKKA